METITETNNENWLLTQKNVKQRVKEFYKENDINDDVQKNEINNRLIGIYLSDVFKDNIYNMDEDELFEYVIYNSYTRFK